MPYLWSFTFLVFFTSINPRNKVSEVYHTFPIRMHTNYKWGHEVHSFSLAQSDKMEIKLANIQHISIVCENFRTNIFTVTLSNILMKNNMYFWCKMIYCKENILLFYKNAIFSVGSDNCSCIQMCNYVHSFHLHLQHTSLQAYYTSKEI
jgi:hypothetical protein